MVLISSRAVFADKTVMFWLLLLSLPFVITIGRLAVRLAIVYTNGKRLGFCVAMLLTFAYFDLVRFDGVDAAHSRE